MSKHKKNQQTLLDLKDSFEDDFDPGTRWVFDNSAGEWVACDTNGKRKYSQKRPPDVKGQGDEAWWNQYATAAGKGSRTGETKTSTKPDAGVIHVFDPASGAVVFKHYVPDRDADWWGSASQEYPPENGVMRIPKDRVTLTPQTPPFNACVYDATKAFCYSQMGVVLDPSDLDWLRLHPLATDGGISFSYMPTAIQQLVEPYGLAVRRVRVRRGKLSLPDSLMQWALALGVNPFGLTDRQTSNAEAIERIPGMTMEQAHDMWRFEFHEHPLKPSVVGETGWTNSQGVSTGASGGHARYVAPRAHSMSWAISVQLARKADVAYKEAPPNPEYVVREGGTKIQYYADIKDSTGKPVCVLRPGSGYVRNDGTAPPPEFNGPTSVAGRSAHTHTPPSAGTSLVSTTKSYAQSFCCTLCATDKDITNNRIGMDRVCSSCYIEQWKGYVCPGCKVQYQYVAPKPLWRDNIKMEAVFECIGTCRNRFIVKDAEAEKYPDLAVLASLVVVDD